MIKTSRSSIQLLNFPLWVLILFWLIAPRKKRGESATQIELAERKDLTNDLYYSLPVPHDWITGKLVMVLIGWINREDNRLMHAVGPYQSLKV